jgi:hypothetical protein
LYYLNQVIIVLREVAQRDKNIYTTEEHEDHEEKSILCYLRVLPW